MVPLFFPEMTLDRDIKLEMVKNHKVIFGPKNSNMQIRAHSKELIELSRKASKSTKSDLFGPRYRLLKIDP